MTYIEKGHAAYGDKCEWVGCGWDASECDVHHINYQEHQAEEDAARERTGAEHYQLPKDNRTVNLSILCPNHHRYTHHKDLGMTILNYIPERK